VSALEETLALQLRALGAPAPMREHRFAAEFVGPGKGLRARLRDNDLQDWRFDFAWPDADLAVEVEGGGWVQGRHTRGKGFEDDLRKYHAAMRLGWTVYRCGAKLIKSGDAADLIVTLLLRERARLAS
jgi:hypothetical protein